MAEEGALDLKHAVPERDDEEPSKEELQRRMEEARESITQTVTEIKETVTNQYNSVKESLDWRTHFRKRPIAFSVGALSVGFLVGYGLAGQLKGNGRSDEDYPSSDETDIFERTGARPSKYENEEEEARRSAFHGHSYAAQPIMSGQSMASDQEHDSTGEAGQASSGDYSPPRGGDYSFSGPRQPAAEQEDEPQKPGLFERFKGTTAYDRLQTEVASLGERFMEQLSSTAQNVVLPALFGKIRELFGVDLSDQKEQGGAKSQGTSTGAKASNASAQAAGASASPASAAPRGSSYATSENRGYEAKGSDATQHKAGGDSVLDLDR